MCEIGFSVTLKFRDNALRQSLAEFHAPLVERVNIPNNALGEDRVFIQGNELTKRFRCELVRKNRVGWPVAGEDAMGHEPIRRALRFHLLGRLAERKRFCLSEYICQQHVVVRPQRIEWFRECDEVTGNKLRSLMNQLIERVLAVCSRLTPVDWAALVRYGESLQRDLLAVALHSQLLEIRGEPLQVLFIRQDCNGLCIEAVVIPDGEQSHQYRQVARERRGTKMLIH